MSGKEKPTFFDCSCYDAHFVIDITKDMRREAQELQSDGNEVDKQDARSNRRSEADSVVGKLAEVAVRDFFEAFGVQAEFNEGWKYDMLIGGNTAEIKARDYSQTAPRFCDLLVRDREDTDWSPSDVDIIVQVMVDGRDSEKAYITGYVSGEEASKCDFFEKAKTHRTREVPHSSLKPIEFLL